MPGQFDDSLWGTIGAMSLPENLGRLRRVGVLGAGGFATVWHYRDDELESDVAVKALADNWAQRADVRERFLEEARILRKADSDHIVRVYDIGEHDDTPYFVMTYADRGSLAELLGQPLAAERVVELVEHAAAGLDVLHEQGVIHRDVKPQNLLLRSQADAEDRLLVADLGVAKAMANASGLTQLVGTPAYMAPEQAEGLPLDARTDVYSLGVLTRALLTGSPEPHPDSDGSWPEVDPRFVAAITTATATDPDQRQPAAGAFAQQLRTGLEGGPLDCGPRSPSQTPRSRTASARFALLAWSLVVLVTTFVAAYLIVAALT